MAILLNAYPTWSEVWYFKANFSNCSFLYVSIWASFSILDASIKIFCSFISELVVSFVLHNKEFTKMDENKIEKNYLNRYNQNRTMKHLEKTLHTPSNNPSMYKSSCSLGHNRNYLHNLYSNIRHYRTQRICY